MKENIEIKTHTPKQFNEATLLHTAETGSDVWSNWRMQGLGGSEIGTILGLNEYKSPYALWAERTGKVDVEPVNNWSVRFGNAFETPILQMWAEDNPQWKVYKTGTYVDNQFPFMQASPDALAQNKDTGEWIILEVKTARYSWDYLPPSYHAQVMHYLDVMSINRGIVIAIAGWNWYEQEIVYDEWQALAQRDSASHFWNLVQTQTEPDFDGAMSTYETVRKLHPDIDPDLSVELPNGEQLVLMQKELDWAQKQLNYEKTMALKIMDKAKRGFVVRDGKEVTVATRRSRENGLPFLVINSK
jgi:putative phage-type endonuclease